MSEIDQMKLDMVTKLASLLMDEQPKLTMEPLIKYRWTRYKVPSSSATVNSSSSATARRIMRRVQKYVNDYRLVIID